MSLVETRTAIKDAIKAALPELRQCEIHGGQFDLDELKRFLTVTPSIRLAMLATPRLTPENSGGIDVDLRLAAFIVTRDAGALAREDAALNIAQAILLLVHGNHWGLDYAHPARDVASRALYSGPVDRTGAALWSVNWNQTVRIGADAFLEDGVLPDSLYVGVSPEIGAAHKADYKDARTGEAPDV